MKERKKNGDALTALLGRPGTQSNHQFHGGLMGSGDPFYSGCTLGNPTSSLARVDGIGTMEGK